jgi:two-component system response regulator (stage 0 sporulation protein A)
VINRFQSEARVKHTILIVDDDADWTHLLKLFFLEKYEVQVVNSAHDAIELACSMRPSLIIVDLVMPSMDGFGMLHRLNDSTQTKIPTILLTGWNTAEVEECASAFGCAAVLGKPVDLFVLDQMVANVLDEAGAHTAKAN